MTCCPAQPYAAPKPSHSCWVTFEPTPNKDRLETGRQNTLCHCLGSRRHLGAVWTAGRSRIVSQAGHQGPQGWHRSPSEPRCPPAPLGAPCCPRGGAPGHRSAPSPRAAVAEWGGCGEAAPCGGRGSSLAGGRPGGGGVRGAAQGSHYPGVITQPNTARPLRQRGAEPGGAQQTPPGAASYPRPAMQDTRPRYPCPVTAWIRASVSPGSITARGAVGGQRFSSPQSLFTSPFTGHLKLTDSGSSRVRADPRAAQSPRSCDSALLPLSAQRL